MLMTDAIFSYKRTLGRVLQVVLAVTIAFSVMLGKDFSLEARQAVFGQRQIQFYVPYSGTTPIVLPPVLLVAHNAGDQESTARRALNHDAAGVEVDVRLVDGVLYATHSAPSGLLPMRAWLAPRLRDAWNYAANATVLKLDLKSTSESALKSLVLFIEARPSDQQIIFVSSNPEALAYLDGALPESIELLSLSSGTDVDRVLDHDGRMDGIDGISIPSWGLTAGRIQALKERGYLIDAWTVNDIERLVELSALGVDIITTDNLAFFDMALDTPQEGNAGL
jgi:hypothetical protein